jgi:hypothetical protein
VMPARDASAADVAPDAATRTPDARAPAADGGDAAAGPDARRDPDAAVGGPPTGSCDGCDRECMLVNLPLGVCMPAPDGTACHGGSGMFCQSCHCTSAP